MDKLNITTKTGVLNELIKPLSAISKECVLSVTKTGIEVKLVDPANIALMWVTYPKKMFDKYKVTKDMKIGVEFDPLKSITAPKFNPRSTVIDIVTNNTNSPIGEQTTMVLKYDGFTDEISLLDRASIRKEPKVPKQDYEAKCEISTKRLLKILKRGEDGEYIWFDIKDGVLTTQTYNSKSIAVTETDTAKGDAKSLYSVDYLLDIVKAIKSNVVSIEMSTDYPIKLSFDVLELGKAAYMQAPRVESE